MKNKIDAVLVVEGSNDVSYLSSFLDTYFFVTNGYDLSDKKVDFLKRVSDKKKIIIFTDPDEAGKVIRKRLENQINGVIDIEIEKNFKKNTKKYGVAEATKETIINSLKPYFVHSEIYREEYDLAKLVSLSKNPTEKKTKLVSEYRLIDGNNKSLENQLNMLEINPTEIRKILEN